MVHGGWAWVPAEPHLNYCTGPDLVSVFESVNEECMKGFGRIGIEQTEWEIRKTFTHQTKLSVGEVLTKGDPPSTTNFISEFSRFSISCPFCFAIIIHAPARGTVAAKAESAKRWGEKWPPGFWSSRLELERERPRGLAWEMLLKLRQGLAFGFL